MIHSVYNIDNFLPDGEAHDGHFLPGIVLAVVVAPFGGPETIDTDGDQSVDRSQRSSVVDDHPQSTQGASERPVSDQDVHRIQRHGNDGNDEIGDRLVDDEDNEVWVQFLLVFVCEENEEVGHGADCGKDEEHCGDDDYWGANAWWTGNSSQKKRKKKEKKKIGGAGESAWKNNKKNKNKNKNKNKKNEEQEEQKQKEQEEEEQQDKDDDDVDNDYKRTNDKNNRIKTKTKQMTTDDDYHELETVGTPEKFDMELVELSSDHELLSVVEFCTSVIVLAFFRWCELQKPLRKRFFSLLVTARPVSIASIALKTTTSVSFRFPSFPTTLTFHFLLILRSLFPSDFSFSRHPDNVTDDKSRVFLDSYVLFHSQENYHGSI